DERLGPPERKRVDPSKLLLSKKEAARILGIDRKTTLRDLIDAGHLTLVPGPRGERIARAQVERLVENGIPTPGVRRRQRKSPKAAPPKGAAARILALSA